MKVFSIICGLFLMASCVFAGQTVGVGLSTNRNVDDFGASILMGTQYCLDSTRDLHLRIEYTKVNWGDSTCLDKIGVKSIWYFSMPVWNENNKAFKFGLHFAGDYRTTGGELGGVIGGELYKDCGEFLFIKDFGVYGYVDYNVVKDYDDFFVVGLGVSINK